MDLSVSSVFEKFSVDVINLQLNQTSMARNSRDWLFENIEKLSNQRLIPAIYREKNIKYGSFARKTKIRPLDDIDLMLCYKGCGGHYKVVMENKTYTIYYDKLPSAPLNSCCDGAILNSRKVIENLKGQLANLSGYRKAEIHRCQEAVTLQLSSYSWNFDIVPCFYTTTGFYLIPDGNGNWKNTDPRIDNERTSAINQQNGGQVLQWIRFMKYWRNLSNNPWQSLSSYAYEQLLLDLSEGMDFGRSMADLVTSALKLQALAITKPIKDPKGIQGNLNPLSKNDQIKLKMYSERHWTIATQATFDDLYRNTPKEAINKWKAIFGTEFPNVD